MALEAIKLYFGWFGGALTAVHGRSVRFRRATGTPFNLVLEART